MDRTVLVLRALGLGDFLTGVPAYRAIRQAFPGHRIVLAAPRVLEPLVPATGAVDELLPAGPLEPLAGRSGPVEVAVNLHGKGPQSTRLLTALNPARLVAFAHPGVPETEGFPEWRAGEHEVLRWARLLTESGVRCEPHRLDLDIAPLAGVEAATVIHPGAAAGARRWPVERWSEVARHELARGRRVLITGAPEERPLAEQLAALAGLGPECVVAGTTDVGTLASLVAGAARVVCADTGIAHLATAVRTPSVVLFGPTSPHHWGPPPDRPWHVALWHGSTGDPLSDRPDPGLLSISAGEVLAALDNLPERQTV